MTTSSRTTRRRTRHAATAVAALALAAVGLTACASSGSTSASGKTGGGTSSSSSSSTGSLPGKGKPTFILGDKNFDEEYVLGDLYQLALEGQGYTVDLKPNLGSSEIADKLLQAGKIDGLPEYTGVIYTELANLGDQPQSAQITYEGAKKYENSHGVTVLNPTPFQDKDGVAVLNSYAQKYHLTSIGDLKNVGSFTFGGPPENRTRYQGVVGMHEAYGLSNLQFVPLSIGSQYTALDEKKVDSIAIFTTDGQLATHQYTVLSDPKNIFGFQQVVPIIRTDVLDKEGPAFSATLNKVDALLTTPAIIALNKAVQIDKQNPATVAKAFLTANNIAT